MKPADLTPPDPPALLGLDPKGQLLYVEALRAMDSGERERACRLFEQLARQPDAPSALRYQWIGALCELGLNEDAANAFAALQAADAGLTARCARVEEMFGAEPASLPPPSFVMTTEGQTRVDFHPAHWSLVKLRDGALAYRADLPAGHGLVFEGLIGKRTGDDECCRIEVDNGESREVVTFNARTIVLSSSGQVARLPLERRLYPFRLVVAGGRSRLWLDGLTVLRSEELLASRATGLRFGLLGSSEALDTNFLFSRVRVGFGVAAGTEIDDLSPVEKPEPWLANLGLLAVHAGKTVAALHWFEAALAGRPDARTVAACSAAVESLAPELRPDSASLGRLLEFMAARGAGEVAQRLTISLASRRGKIAVACQGMSIYFARNPQIMMRPMELLKRTASPRRYFEANYWYAVRDVSFELRYGDVLAIVGNNGAGKSTLLRALAGMLDYEGNLAVYGDARLLVMGLGIQEDLTGRENVALGCLYLGLRRRVIAGIVDQIIEFAELTEHQHLPYRFYSDGMKARLLFAIATSVDPDILLLDELLGAGDVRFRAKAMARMDQLLERSKAMIVITHNLSFVRERATHAIYLDHGRVRYQGEPNRAVDFYLEDNRVGGASPETAGSFMMQEV